MSPPHPATTLLLLRPEHEGFSLFMVQRHRKSGFMPSAWVFPGGRVDAADQLVGSAFLRGGERVAAAMKLPYEQAVPYLVAGVRETFEEAGIWLGTGALPQSLRAPLNRGEVALIDLLAEYGAALDLDRLLPWSWWVTPEAEPRRFDTRFLVAFTEAAHDDARHDEVETVDSGWYAPQHLLEGGFPMAPPTWWTLKELAVLGTAEAVLEACWSREQVPIQPILRLGEATLDLLLPGHADHPADAIPGLPERIAFEQGRWWAKH